MVGSRHKFAKGARGGVHTPVLTWLSGVEVVVHGGPVMEQAVSRTNAHLVDVGCSLGLVIPRAKQVRVKVGPQNFQEK